MQHRKNFKVCVAEASINALMQVLKYGIASIRFCATTQFLFLNYFFLSKKVGGDLPLRGPCIISKNDLSKLVSCLFHLLKQLISTDFVEFDLSLFKVNNKCLKTKKPT